VHVTADHRQVHLGHGAHAKLLEHGDMAVATANEDQVVDNRRLLLVHAYLSKGSVSVVAGYSIMWQAALQCKGHTLFLQPVLGKP
jgi:hypothetical protein